MRQSFTFPSTVHHTTSPASSVEMISRTPGKKSPRRGGLSGWMCSRALGCLEYLLRTVRWAGGGCWQVPRQQSEAWGFCFLMIWTGGGSVCFYALAAFFFWCVGRAMRTCRRRTTFCLWGCVRTERRRGRSSRYRDFRHGVNTDRQSGGLLPLHWPGRSGVREKKPREEWGSKQGCEGLHGWRIARRCICILILVAVRSIRYRLLRALRCVWSSIDLSLGSTSLQVGKNPAMTTQCFDCSSVLHTS